MKFRRCDALQNLPIYPCLDKIVDTLYTSPVRSLILTAETGAGKSTAVPVALLESFSGRILMLEPRRLAVHAVASRVAELIGEKTGETVGYRMHLETNVGPDTRYEVMTEAVLIRTLQQDPELSGVSVVVLDEFHERSVHADLVLAFLHDVMELRDDLFLLIMSASIDAEPLSAYLGSAPVLHIKGKRFPVNLEYRSPAESDCAVFCAAAVTEELVNLTDGSMLVFLPGISDIRRCEQLLSGKIQAEICILHSSVPFEKQKILLSASATGRRVILSSAVAETSITIPDVRIVIDSGLSRVSRYDSTSGMNTLATETESIFSAQQRAGRAGRTGPGRCIRMWAEYDSRIRNPPPEILRTDISAVVLECALWGAISPSALHWLTVPAQSSWQTAQTLLNATGCLTTDGHITQTGKNALTLGIHPRIACVALQGTETALRLAARYGVRSAVPGNNRDIQRLYDDLKKRLSRLDIRPQKYADSTAVLLAGFPDRLARRISEDSAEYQLITGRMLRLRDAKPPFPRWIIAAEADSGERLGCVYRWESLTDTEAEQWAYAHAETDTETVFDRSEAGKIRKTEYTRCGAIVLKQRTLPVQPEDIRTAVCMRVKTNGLSALPLSASAHNLLMRCRFRSAVLGLKADTDIERARQGDEAALAACAEEWLFTFSGYGDALTEKGVYDALCCFLDNRIIERDVPQQLTLENGRICRVLYEAQPGAIGGVQPVIEIIIQQIFGCRQTPVILGKPVLLRLLSPARRPLQITADLAGFWQNTWPQICKEMKGRYPKHNWNPM